MLQTPYEIRVCMDIGSSLHYAAIGLSSGEKITGFTVKHTPEGIQDFFQKIKNIENQYGLPVSVAMEGYNGYARPIDTMVLDKGYKLFNVNNLKLSRFKEIFPAPAKTDEIDVWKIFEMFTMKDTLPLAKSALQEVVKPPQVNEKLKRITRRRRDIVIEKGQITNRLHADLESICPGILSITGSIDNIWFLKFLVSREDITKLVGLQKTSILKIKGVGKKYAAEIQNWQKTATFSADTAWVGEMVIRDAKRVLELLKELATLEKIIENLIPQSEIASRIMTLTGFGPICSAELAGEIGEYSRFQKESSLAVYVGMGVLSNQSGKYSGVRRLRCSNFRAKGAMMTATARHIAHNSEAKKYYDKKRAEGKKHNQAVRALGRHLIRVIWSMLKNKRDYLHKD